MTESGAEALMHAVVKRACADWAQAMKQLEKDLGDRHASGMMRECERFFRSDYFRDLTGIPGKDFLEKLRRHYSHEC